MACCATAFYDALKYYRKKQYSFSKSIGYKKFTIFDVNIEDSTALDVKNIEVNFIFFARLLLSLRWFARRNMRTTKHICIGQYLKFAKILTK